MKPTNSLDIEKVRSHFPGLNNGWTFFDNAGGSQILRPVVERLSEYLYNRNAQTGGTYPASLATKESVELGRKAMAMFVNAARTEEVVLAPSSTVALQLLAKSLLSQLQEGDEIIVTSSDHESNIGPWVNLEREGIEIKFWDPDRDSLELNPETLESLITPRTKLVAVTHVSNILGTVNPIKEFAEIVHAHGAMICVDSVAFAPHRAIDVQDLGVDFLVFSTYKTYGPHMAVLYCNYERLLELDVVYHYFHSNDDLPRKMEPGNPNYELTYSLTGITDYLQALSPDGLNGRAALESVFDSIERHERELCSRLLSFLNTIPDVNVYGRPDGNDPDRVPTISFRLGDKDPGEIARSVEKSNIAIRYGDFYARRLTDFLGVTDRNGVVRVSMVHYNSLEEVDALINAFEKEWV